MRKTKKRGGYTLSEVIITLIILSMLGLIVTIVFNAAFKGRDLIDREASIQAEMRTTMQYVNNSVEKATSIFILDDSKYDPSVKGFKMTEGWNYIGLSADGKKIVNHVWNKAEKKWDIKDLGVKSLYDMELSLHFETSLDYEDNRVVKYDVQGKYPDSKNILKIDTAIMSLNSKQIFSKVTRGKKGVALAYRNDPIEGQKLPDVAVSVVFDVSTSMNQDMQGKEVKVADKQAGVQDRMDILKEKATGLMDTLSSVGTVKVNLVKFGWGGDYVLEPFENLRTSMGVVKEKIGEFKPEGATNPGAGLRYGMVSLAKEKADLKYVVILTDGGPNVYTRRRQRNTISWETVTAYDLTDQVWSNDLSENVWADNVPDNRRYQYGLYYPGRVAQTFGKGIDHVHFIGYSGIESERSAAKEMSRDIGRKGVASTYHDASSAANLESAFSEITRKIAQDLWFVSGP